MTLRLSLRLSLASCVLSLVGCGGSGGTAADTGTDAGGSGIDGGGIDGGGTDGGGSDGGGSDAGGDGGSMGDACTPTRTTAVPLPVDVYVMLSQAASMGDAAGSGSKWDGVTSGLRSFTSDPGATTLSMGIQYFGLVATGSCPSLCNVDADCGSCGPCIGVISGIPGTCAGAGGDSCLADDYAMPDVEIAALPGAAATIGTSLGLHGPSTATALSAALQGAVDHLEAWHATHAGHVVATLVVTSSEPTECDTTLSGVSAIAATALAGTSHVRTFVAGVTNGLTSVDGIAAAGGTVSAFTLDPSGAPLAAQTLDALAAMRDTLVCTYEAPAAANVGVEVGGAPVSRVGDLGACGTSDGWYLDGANVVLCPTTCGAASTSGDPVTLVSGC